jgi:hypothetical protein
MWLLEEIDLRIRLIKCDRKVIFLGKLTLAGDSNQPILRSQMHR